jgi:hypothetical protein
VLQDIIVVTHVHPWTCLPSVQHAAIAPQLVFEESQNLSTHVEVSVAISQEREGEPEGNSGQRPYNYSVSSLSLSGFFFEFQKCLVLTQKLPKGLL